MNSWYQMAKTLPLSQRDATDLRKAENDAKVVTNNAMGESFVMVAVSLYILSNYTFHDSKK